MAAIGVPQRRLEGGEKVTGSTLFTADLRIDGLAHARLVLSTVAAGRIVEVDTSAARAVPGVLTVATGEDLGEAHGLLLARGQVRYVGEPVAVVVAATEQAAADAANAVLVEYEPLPPVVDPFRAMEPGARVVLDQSAAAIDDAEAHGVSGGGEEATERPPNVTAQTRFAQGDPEAAFAACKEVVGGRFVVPAVHQAFLEPHVTAARLEPDGGITVWTSTQGQFFVRRSVADALQIPIGKVRIVAMAVGGGFGGKVHLLESLVAMLAMRIHRPVRLELTRTEEFLMGRGGPGCTVDLRLGADAEGNLRALAGTVVFDNGAGPGGLGGAVAGLLASTYRVPDYEVVALDVATNKTPVAAYRAPGSPQGYFALESAMDELAHKLGMNPIEFRLRNAAREGDPRPGRGPWPRIGLIECLEAACEHPLATSPLGPGEGLGVAVGSWGGGIEPAAAGCRVEEDGTLAVQLGSQDISGTNTGLAMIAAETFGVSVDRVRIESLDTGGAPYAGMAGGSKITYTVGPAVREAAAQARRQLLEIGAEELEAALEDLEISDGRVQVKGVPGRARGIGELALLGAQFGGQYPPVHGHGRTVVKEQSPMFTVHLARARVDPETGAYTLTGYAAVQDVGRAINPPEILGQVHGGALQGLGRALGEELHYDEEGQLRTASFVEYGIPSVDQAPAIDVQLIEVPSPIGPYGAKGVGEPPAVPGPAALANAVAAACGVRPYRLPIDSAELARRS